MRFSQLGIPVVTEFPEFPHVGDSAYLSTGITTSYHYIFDGINWIQQTPAELITYEPSNYTPADDSLNSHLEAIDDALAGGGGGASALDDLTDVILTAPAISNFLKFNGADWVNSFIQWTDISGKPLTFAPAAHTHPASDVVSGTFDDARISESSVVQWDGSFSIAWAQLTGVPGTFAPSAHTHVLADVTDAGAMASQADAPVDGEQYVRLDGDWSRVAADSVTKTITQVAHGFTIGNAIYLNGSTWAKADRDADTSTATALVYSVTSANVFVAILSGWMTLTTGQWDAITGGSGGLVAGDHYWLSSTVGGITATQPTSGLAQHILTADSTTRAIVDIGEVTDVTVAPSVFSTIGASFDGQGSAVAAGSKTLPISIDYACTIVSVRAFADIATNAVFDIWVDTFANSPPTVADTITAADKPTLTAATKVEDTSIGTWSLNIAAGSVLIFNIDSCSAATKLGIQLKVTRT